MCVKYGEKAQGVDVSTRDLMAALPFVRKEPGPDMLRAWDLFRRMYARIDHQFDKLRDLDLQYASPRLKAPPLSVVMPGTYKAVQKSNVFIQRFLDELSVLDTAQRPPKRAHPGLGRHAVHVPAQGPRGPATGRA